MLLIGLLVLMLMLSFILCWYMEDVLDEAEQEHVAQLEEEANSLFRPERYIVQ
jgi:hypothetical protein